MPLWLWPSGMIYYLAALYCADMYYTICLLQYGAIFTLLLFLQLLFQHRVTGLCQTLT